MSERKVSQYVCGCALVAEVQRDGDGLPEKPHSPLVCPVHRQIWARVDTVESASVHDALERVEERTGAVI